MSDSHSPGVNVAAVTKALGERLAAARQQLYLTQQRAVDLYLERTGKQLGVRALYSYELGQRIPPMEKLLELADVYGVPASVLLAEAERKAGRDPACPTCGRDSDG